MKLPGVRFTVRRMMAVVAVLAIACCFGEPFVRHPSPRTFLPPLMILYLTWASRDSVKIMLVGQSWSRPKLLLALTGLVLLVVAGAAIESKWADFRERSRFHESQEFLCRLSAQGTHGPLIGCGQGVSVLIEAPQADGPEEREEMHQLADYHARLAIYYRSHW